MVTASVDLAHVFVGCNAISNAFCANSACAVATSHSQPQYNGNARFDAAFAAKNAVALVSRDSKNAELLKIEQTLQHRVATGDATRITSIFMNSAGSRDRVFAGDSEGNVFLWQRESSNNDQWQLINLSSVPVSSPQESSVSDASAASTAMKRLSTSSVAAVTAAQTSRRWIYFVSFSNGTLVAFEQDKQQSPKSVRVLAQLDLGVRFIMEGLTASTIDLPTKDREANVLLAAGGVDSKVHLYEVPGSTSRLNQLLVLEGHRGWIRGLSFEKQQHSVSPEKASRSLFLASASQDQRIRLWKVTAEAEQSDDSSSTPSSISTESTTTNETRDGFQAAGTNCSYTVSFDALLIGHEDWVTSLEWTLVPKASSSSNNGAETEAEASYESALVSSSMDNALIVWKKNMQLGVSGAWFPSLRVGEMGGNGILKGIVLPSDSDRLELLALNFMGQLERWKQQASPSKIFLPSASLTGHCSTVTDLSWSPSGDYLLSVSLDQTARVLAPLKKQGHESWHEISRAQVHGYDLNCACFLLGNDGRETTANDRFVSGADEKILRVFEAPDDIQSLVRKLSGQVSESESAQQPRVQHAYLPELSLTNKTPADASSSASESSNGGYAAIDVDSPSLRLPVGDTLGKKTLWPEQRKLYGHGNELLCVTSNHSGSLIASACKSREERFASVWLWNTSDWSVAQAPLEGHKSSVVQLAFSPNDQFLVSVSRDRHFCIYEKKMNGEGTSQFALVEKFRAHKRIIWSCSWSPDSRFVATASRDQTFALWGQIAAAGASSGWGAVGKPVSLESAVTAVAFAPLVSSQQQDLSYVVAVGLESGAIKLFNVTEGEGGSVEIKLISEVDFTLSASATVTRLAWSPRHQKQDNKSSVFVLAASSSDYSVRLYNVQLK